MFGFGKHRGKKKVEITVIEETVIVIEGQKWFHEHHKHRHDVRMVHSTTLNNTKLQIMSFTLPVNQKAPIQVALQDVVTGQAAADAVASNVANVSDNPAAATVDADNNLVGVAAGTGNLTTDADWTYTDSLGAPQTTHKQVVTPFEITAVATANDVQMVVTLGTPVNQ
jgi:hypothetical protein